MLNFSQSPPRPRLTGRIFAYALADIFGLTAIALGGIWLATNKQVLFKDFPSSTAEAVAAIVGGALLMIWAVGHILQEIGKQSDELNARFAAYMGQTPSDHSPQTPSTGAKDAQ